MHSSHLGAFSPLVQFTVRIFFYDTPFPIGLLSEAFCLFQGSVRTCRHSKARYVPHHPTAHTPYLALTHR